MNTLKTGLSFAIMVVVGYSVCALLAVLFPSAFLALMNALFHGLDFGRLVAPPALSFGAFVSALGVFAVWAFAMGALFAWVWNHLPAAHSRPVRQPH